MFRLESLKQLLAAPQFYAYFPTQQFCAKSGIRDKVLEISIVIIDRPCLTHCESILSGVLYECVHDYVVSVVLFEVGHNSPVR